MVNRVITYEEGKAAASQFQAAAYLECSAKDNDGVEEVNAQTQTRFSSLSQRK